MQVKTIALAAALSVVPGLVQAQFDFKLAGRDVQIHSFASQGFGYSNENNYLTMKTSKGSFAMTDGGVNISTQLTDRLRIGAQIYLRNVGKLGDWHPVLDWAFADYKFKDWFGLRGGKVKTTLGLFNDSQDNEFLHTWALLPQSVYPLDLRGSTIAHNGGDAYGRIPLQRLGHLDYTAYGGARSVDQHEGWAVDLPDFGFTQQKESGSVMGADLRWATPLKELLVGASHATYGHDNRVLGGPTSFLPGFLLAGHYVKNYTNAFYFDYSPGKLRLYGEYQRVWGDYRESSIDSQQHQTYLFSNTSDSRVWYTAISYRISKRLEVGTYHSRFYGNWSQAHSEPDNHLFDQVATARIDLNPHWDVKVEGHFMDGAPAGFVGGNLHGFYTGTNPNGFKPSTNMLVIRTGFAF